MNGLRKHQALIAFILSIAVAASLMGITYSRKDQAHFEWTDLSGDRQALSAIRLSGQLRDGYHTASFALDEGVVDARTAIAALPEQVMLNQYSPGGALPLGDMEYEVYGAGTYEIRARNLGMYKNRIRTAHVAPPLIYRTGNGDSNSQSYTNPLEYGLAAIGETVYYTVPTTAGYEGTNGIYELSFADGYFVPEEGHAPRAIAAIDLDSSNRPGLSHSLNILGLEAAGGKLALLLVRDGQLAVQSYNPHSGEMEGEAVIAGLPIFVSGEPASGGGQSGITYSANYRAFANEREQLLILCFNGWAESAAADDGGNAPTIKAFVTISLKEGAQAIDQTVEYFRDGIENSYNDVMVANYIEGKLYIAKLWREYVADGGRNNPILLPIRFMLYVYEQGTRVYTGELKTDLNDDLIRTVNLPFNGSFSYNQTEYRFFSGITIQEADR